MPRTMNPETNPKLLKKATHVTFDQDELLSKLWDSAALGDNDAVKLMLKLFPDLDHDNYKKGGYSPFLIAVTNKRTDCVRSFLEQGKITLDRQYGNTKNTAVHIAVSMKHSEIVQMLKQAGARFDIKNADQETANSLITLQNLGAAIDTVTTDLSAHTPMYKQHCLKSKSVTSSSKENTTKSIEKELSRPKLILSS